jgi:hypothetical protein
VADDKMLIAPCRQMSLEEAIGYVRGRQGLGCTRRLLLHFRPRAQTQTPCPWDAAHTTSAPWVCLL